MQKKVFILEDDTSIVKIIEEKLGEEFLIYRCRSVDEAIGEYKQSVKNNMLFDCFIIDLDVSPIGLKEEEMKDFFARAGYAWLKNYVWKDLSAEALMAMKQKTIICSRYVNNLKKERPENEWIGLHFVDKKPKFDDEVMKEIMKICHNN